MSWALRFLGVGSAQATAQLGSACGVLERDGEPVLMIDCGQEALTAFLDHYGEPPRAIYITHTHMDHVGGIERLFYKIYFDGFRGLDYSGAAAQSIILMVLVVLLTIFQFRFIERRVHYR